MVQKETIENYVEKNVTCFLVTQTRLKHIVSTFISRVSLVVGNFIYQFKIMQEM